MIKKLLKHIVFFINSKWYMLSLLLSAIAGYGYELFHTTCGIDDIAIDMYFEDGLGVAIGRWPFYYINKLVPIAEYRPFLMDFIAVLFLMLGAIIWCAVIREIVKEELPILCYIVFSTMFLLYSLIAEVFIYYLQNGIAIIYCLVGISIFGFYYLWTNQVQMKQKILLTISLTGIVCISISFYESAANLYLFGTLLVLFLDSMEERRLHLGQWKTVVGILSYITGTLVCSIIGRTVITRITMQAFSIKEYFFRSVSSIEWLTSGNLRTVYVELVMLVKAIVRDYFAVGAVYYPIMLFAVATVLFIVLVFYKAIKERDFWIFLYGMATYASLYVLTFIQCDTLKYRSCQMFSVFVAFVLMIVTNAILKQVKWLKTVGVILVSGVLIYSAVDLNEWFVLEYERNQTELQVVDEIAQDLQCGQYDIKNKPVVFVGEFSLDKEIIGKCFVEKGEPGWNIVNAANEWLEIETDSYCYTQILGQSLIDWAVEGLSAYGGYNTPMQKLFEYCGYSFLWADSELYEEIMPIYYDYYGEGYEYMKTEAYGEEEQYPYEGYILETEDYIVVRL